MTPKSRKLKITLPTKSEFGKYFRLIGRMKSGAATQADVQEIYRFESYVRSLPAHLTQGRLPVGFGLGAAATMAHVQPVAPLPARSSPAGEAVKPKPPGDFETRAQSFQPVNADVMRHAELMNLREGIRSRLEKQKVDDLTPEQRQALARTNDDYAARMQAAMRRDERPAPVGRLSRRVASGLDFKTIADYRQAGPAAPPQRLSAEAMRAQQIRMGLTPHQASATVAAARNLPVQSLRQIAHAQTGATRFFSKMVQQGQSFLSFMNKPIAGLSKAGGGSIAAAVGLGRGGGLLPGAAAVATVVAGLSKNIVSRAYSMLGTAGDQFARWMGLSKEFTSGPERQAWQERFSTTDSSQQFFEDLTSAREGQYGSGMRGRRGAAARNELGGHGMDPLSELLIRSFKTTGPGQDRYDVDAPVTPGGVRRGRTINVGSGDNGSAKLEDDSVARSRMLAVKDRLMDQMTHTQSAVYAMPSVQSFI